jgi:hypothetical protein
MVQKMSEHLNNKTPLFPSSYIGEIGNLVQWINEILSRCPDKDWNYSRIRLRVIDVTTAQAPYLLGCELIDHDTPAGKRELRDVQDEVAWGERHSSELGILELISLRANRALIELIGDNFYVTAESPGRFHPVLRLVKKQDLVTANIKSAIWYEVQEVAGEEFENR